jgi:hypothetical protein
LARISCRINVACIEAECPRTGFPVPHFRLCLATSSRARVRGTCNLLCMMKLLCNGLDVKSSRSFVTYIMAVDAPAGFPVLSFYSHLGPARARHCALTHVWRSVTRLTVGRAGNPSGFTPPAQMPSLRAKKFWSPQLNEVRSTTRSVTVCENVRSLYHFWVEIGPWWVTLHFSTSSYGS